MPRVRTHYDNLKVARNAPAEVIRAAYRALSQKYHPDHNPGSAEAARAMAMFNAAYEVLSDPVKRDLHDQWIRRAESEPRVEVPRPTPQAHPAATPTSRESKPARTLVTHVRLH